MIEGYKKNIENLKAQKENTVKDFKKQIEKLEIEIGNYKCELYFSLISTNLVTNINNILNTEYQIYTKQKRA